MATMKRRRRETYATGGPETARAIESYASRTPAYKEGPVELLKIGEKPYGIAKNYEEQRMTWEKEAKFTIQRIRLRMGRKVIIDDKPTDREIARFRVDIAHAAQKNQEIKIFVQENPDLRVELA